MTPTALVSRASNRLKDLLFLPGTERYWTRRLSGQVLALLYHRVVATDEHAFLARGGTPTTPLAGFEEDLDLLRNLGGSFVTFNDLRRGTLPEEGSFGIAITFDDGFQDTYRIALPCLESRGIRATVFQCTAMIESAALLLEHQYYWWGASAEASSELARIGAHRGWPALGESGIPRQTTVNPAPWICTVPLTELETVRGQMEARFPIPAGLPAKLYPVAEDLTVAMAGGHEIGSHGHGHLHRMTMTSEAFEADLRESATVLRRILGVQPLAYSFPYNARAAGDSEICLRYFDMLATVEPRAISRDFDPTQVPRSTWPATKSRLRNRRWLLTGAI